MISLAFTLFQNGVAWGILSLRRLNHFFPYLRLFLTPLLGPKGPCFNERQNSVFMSIGLGEFFERLSELRSPYSARQKVALENA